MGAIHSMVDDDSDRLEMIRLSHYRSERAGLAPSSPIDLAFEDFDRESRLLAAAKPVLDRLQTALHGNMAGGLLCDRNATIVERYHGLSEMAEASDRLGAVVGASFSEGRTGTNALSVAVETRSPILINSHEHFLQELQGFTCYGAPIINPVTKRLEGVLDLMVEESVAPGLMTSLLDRAVDEIVSGLISDYDPETALSVAAFTRLSRRTQDGITLVGRDFIVHNLKAADMVSAADAELLRELARRLPLAASEAVLLSSGTDVTVTSASSGTSNTVLLCISDGARNHAPVPRRPRVFDKHRTTIDTQIVQIASGREAAFIVGPSGAGSSRAAHMVVGADAGVIDCSTAGTNVGARLRELVEMASDSDGRGVIIEHVEMMDPASVHSVVSTMRTAPHLRVAATATPRFADDADISYFASTFSVWLEIPPLRQRPQDVPILVEDIVESLCAERGLSADRRPRVTRAVVDHLKTLGWPGNVAELRAVLAATIGARSVGDIVIADLPKRYRTARATKTNLTPIEQAERDLILQTLSSYEGNKVRTAEYLGISRSKLYDRIRHFGIETP